MWAEESSKWSSLLRTYGDELGTGRSGKRKKSEEVSWGQILEGLDCQAKKFELSLLDNGKPLEILGNRLMWHYQSCAFIRFIKHHYVEMSRGQ